MTTYFGGLDREHDFKSLSNIVFANGKIDPWIAGSVNFKASEKTLTLNIDKAAHHLDL